MLLVPATPAAWAARFQAERQTVLDVLPGAAVEHIGSTSLGMPAKDVVDVLVGVRPPEFEDAVERVRSRGFVVDGRRVVDGEPHVWLARMMGGHRRTIVYVVVVGGSQWTDRRTFRDRLRDDPSLRQRYLRIKQHAAAGTDDWSTYTASKAAFVEEVLAGT